MELSSNPGYRAGTVSAMRDPIDAELALQLQDLRALLGLDGSRGPIKELLCEALKDRDTCFDFLTYR